MKIAVIDYGSGNLRSAAKSVERAAGELGLSAEVLVTSDPDHVAEAERIILPGVGAFADCAAGLQALEGMWQVLEEAVLRQGKPFFGHLRRYAVIGRIAVWSTAKPQGLAGFRGRWCLSSPARGSKSHTWAGNTLSVAHDHPVLDGLGADPHAYFVHSFQFVPQDRHTGLRQLITAPKSARLIGRDNMIGHSIPPGKKPAHRACPFAQFLGVEPMILFPAIDLKDGQCVRLKQGEMAEASRVQHRSGGARGGFRGARLCLGPCRRFERRL